MSKPVDFSGSTKTTLMFSAPGRLSVGMIPSARCMLGYAPLGVTRTLNNDETPKLRFRPPVIQANWPKNNLLKEESQLKDIMLEL